MHCSRHQKPLHLHQHLSFLCQIYVIHYQYMHIAVCSPVATRMLRPVLLRCMLPAKHVISRHQVKKRLSGSYSSRFSRGQRQTCHSIVWVNITILFWHAFAKLGACSWGK